MKSCFCHLVMQSEPIYSWIEVDPVIVLGLGELCVRTLPLVKPFAISFGEYSFFGYEVLVVACLVPVAFLVQIVYRWILGL